MFHSSRFKTYIYRALIYTRSPIYTRSLIYTRFFSHLNQIYLYYHLYPIFIPSIPDFRIVSSVPDFYIRFTLTPNCTQFSSHLYPIFVLSHLFPMHDVPHFLTSLLTSLHFRFDLMILTLPDCYGGCKDE